MMPLDIRRKRAAIAISAICLIMTAFAFLARAERESEIRAADRKEVDRDGDGKIDMIEESFQLQNEIVLKHIERIDGESGELEIRVTLLVLQGSPFWSEWCFSDGKKLSFVERKCPFGLGFADKEVVLFGQDRKGIAMLRRDQSGKLVPSAAGEIEVMNEATVGLKELIKSVEPQPTRRTTDAPKNNETVH